MQPQDFLSVFSTFGNGSYVIQTPNGSTIKYSSNRPSIQFSHLSDPLKEMIWSQYIQAVEKENFKKPLPLEKRIVKIEKEIKKIDPTFNHKIPKLPLNESPEEYLKCITDMQEILKKAFIKVCAKRNEFVLSNDNSFDPVLDKTERRLLQTFDQIFTHYYTAEKYQEALAVLRKVKESSVAERGFLSLANIFFLKNQDETVLECLQQLGSISTENLHIFLSEERFINANDRLYNIIKKLPATARNNFISCLVEIYCDKHLEQLRRYITLLNGSYEKDQAYGKVFNFYLKKSDYPSAEKIVSSFSGSYERDTHYIKLIEIFYKSENIEEILKLTLKLSGSYERDVQYQKLIKFYLKQNKISEALKIISMLSGSYEKNIEYGKIIDQLLASNRLSEAKEIIPLISDSYTREQEKAKFFKFI